MVNFSSAFLICSTFLGIHDWHPHTYALFQQAERSEIGLVQLVQGVSSIDSERGIPLAECLLEQYSMERIYKLSNYPKPTQYLVSEKQEHDRIRRRSSQR